MLPVTHAFPAPTRTAISTVKPTTLLTNANTERFFHPTYKYDGNLDGSGDVCDIRIESFEYVNHNANSSYPSNDIICHCKM